MSRIVLDEAKVAEYLMNSPIFMPRRRIANRSDFGDKATIGLHTKRIGVSLPNLELGKDTGTYLGLHEGKYIIAIRGFGMICYVGYEAYDSLEELKQHWQLD